MQIQSEFSLKAFNTFGIEATASAFCRLKNPDDLISITRNADLPVLILGGGSNILFTKDPEKLVIHNEIEGISVIKNIDKEVLVKAGSGVVWHEFVLWCIENNFGGVENLSLIPGTVGASPIQNIGAYGIELKDVFESLEAIELVSGKLHVFKKEECYFGYRDSIFKQELKGKLCITSVTFRLTKEDHQLNYSYSALKVELDRKGLKVPTIRDISNAVMDVRKSKLPDPTILGNAGSFFKNPEVKVSLLDEIQKIYPEIPFYPTTDGMVKIPAGWLIEKRGWKGKRIRQCGSHAKQALVLVNYGGATGQELLDLAYTIIADVNDHFGIELSPEVNIL